MAFGAERILTLCLEAMCSALCSIISLVESTQFTGETDFRTCDTPTRDLPLMATNAVDLGSMSSTSNAKA